MQLLIFMMCILAFIDTFDGNNKSTVVEMALIEMFSSYRVNKTEKCLSRHWSLSLLHYSVTFNISRQIE